MRKPDLKEMEFDELMALHDKLTKILARKMIAEKLELEDRLATLRETTTAHTPQLKPDGIPRRRYAKVLPKYRNPLSSETWSGRGKKPRWLIAAINAGHKMEEYEISRVVKRVSRKTDK